MKDLVFRLSESTGLSFRIHDDTCEPVGLGDKFTYWIVSNNDGGFDIAALNMFGEGDTLTLSLIHISEPTRRHHVSRMPSSA